MPDTSTHLLLPYLLAAQAQKHVTVNEALRLLDGLVQLAVLDRHLTAPPASPADGARYIVASGATGACPSDHVAAITTRRVMMRRTIRKPPTTREDTQTKSGGVCKSTQTVRQRRALFCVR